MMTETTSEAHRAEISAELAAFAGLPFVEPSRLASALGEARRLGLDIPPTLRERWAALDVSALQRLIEGTLAGAPSVPSARSAGDELRLEQAASWVNEVENLAAALELARASEGPLSVARIRARLLEGASAVRDALAPVREEVGQLLDQRGYEAGRFWAAGAPDDASALIDGYVLFGEGADLVEPLAASDPTLVEEIEALVEELVAAGEPVSLRAKALVHGVKPQRFRPPRAVASTGPDEGEVWLGFGRAVKLYLQRVGEEVGASVEDPESELPAPPRLLWSRGGAEASAEMSASSMEGLHQSQPLTLEIWEADLVALVVEGVVWWPTSQGAS